MVGTLDTLRLRSEIPGQRQEIPRLAASGDTPPEAPEDPRGQCR